MHHYHCSGFTEHIPLQMHERIKIPDTTNRIQSNHATIYKQTERYIDKKEIQHKFPSYLPKLDGFIIGGKKKQGTIGRLAPSNFVNFFLYFQALEIVKLKKEMQTKLEHRNLRSLRNKCICACMTASKSDERAPQAHDSGTPSCNGTQGAD